MRQTRSRYARYSEILRQVVIAFTVFILSSIIFHLAFGQPEGLLSAVVLTFLAGQLYRAA